jgi:four helix bundle protein
MLRKKLRWLRKTLRRSQLSIFSSTISTFSSTFQTINKHLIMHTYPFEKLIVWQRSRELNKQIYTITSKFPSEEKFGIVSQIRRAGISVSNNLAEGSARISPKEQARFSEISYSSLMEVLNLYLLAHDLNLINHST